MANINDLLEEKELTISRRNNIVVSIRRSGIIGAAFEAQRMEDLFAIRLNEINLQIEKLSPRL